MDAPKPIAATTHTVDDETVTLAQRRQAQSSFLARVAGGVLVLTVLVGWRLMIGLNTLAIDPRTMKMRQDFAGLVNARDLARERASSSSTQAMRATKRLAENASASAATAPTKNAPTKNAAEPGDFSSSLRRLQGMEEDLDFIGRAGVPDAGRKNPCWTTGDSTPPMCLPYFYILGAWQSGTEELGSRLLAGAPTVGVVRAPHFWNEHTKTLENYANTFASVATMERNVVAGDASPGYLATSWSESIRFHRAYLDHMRDCWAECQTKSSKFEDDESAKDTADEDAARRGTSRASPRRRCIDGVEGDPKAPGCVGEANAKDPYDESGGHGLSLPHLMSTVYGSSPPRFVVIVREPGARLHSAFWHYEHYKKQYGANEDGFAAYAEQMMTMFQKCLDRGNPLRGCANRFETYSPEFEAVFYHADALIKSMYDVFLETWLDVFPRESFLVVKGEDLWSDNVNTSTAAMRRVLKHLDLDASDETARRLATMNATSNDWRFARDDPERVMRDDIRTKLDAFFAPRLQRLATLVGEDLY